MDAKSSMWRHVLCGNDLLHVTVRHVRQVPMREKSCGKTKHAKNAKTYKAMAYQNKEAQVLPKKKSPMQASEATSSVIGSIVRLSKSEGAHHSVSRRLLQT